MKTMMTAKGSALAIAAVCRACKPPLTSRTAATSPAQTAQNMRCQTGGFCAPPLVIMSMTNAPESADVTKKVTISSVATPDETAERGNSASVSNSATGMLVATVRSEEHTSELQS